MYYLHSDTATYSVLTTVSKHDSGSVLKAVTANGEEVMIQTFNYAIEEKQQRELSKWKEICVQNPEGKFTVKLFEWFVQNDITYLVSEMRDVSLLTMSKEEVMPLCLQFIRPIAKQLFLALEELQLAKTVHGDITPVNVVFVDERKQPHRIKLIKTINSMKPNSLISGNKDYYRAPEIGLGLPVTEAVDVWGVGCTLAFLYLGYHITQEAFNSLDDLNVKSIAEEAEFEDAWAFVNLLKQLLQPSSENRISAHEALQHPFITMVHLIHHFDSKVYLGESRTVMGECQLFSGEPDQECCAILSPSKKKYRLVLHSTTDSYTILDKIGSGSFGNVVMCQNRTTKEKVVVKIPKPSCRGALMAEMSILKEIGVLFPDNKHILKFLGECGFRGRTCLVFEKLDQSLHTYIRARKAESLLVIRPIAKQLFLALGELGTAQIVHADIKPDNIMFVDKQRQPLWIKLIDFGLANRVFNFKTGMTLQAVAYRSPEIYLGLPITEAIDMWGVGCTLAFLFLGCHLFTCFNECQMVRRIVDLLGQPEDHLLSNGKFTHKFFKFDKGTNTWGLKKEKFSSTWKSEVNNITKHLTCLQDLIHIHPTHSEETLVDTTAFVDLMQQMLHLDWNKRISPRNALQHPFITMEHLTQQGTYKDYLNASQAVMDECPAFSRPSQDSSGAKVSNPDPLVSTSQKGTGQHFRLSEEAKDKNSSTAVLDSSCCLQRLLTRIPKFFPRVKNSDGEIPPVPDKKDLEVDPLHPGHCQCSKYENSPVRSPERPEQNSSCSDVPASTGRLKKLHKRIRKLCCRVKRSDGKIPPVPDGDISQRSTSENIPGRTSQRTEQDESRPDVSTSAGCWKIILRRIGRLKVLTCRWRIGKNKVVPQHVGSSSS
ncbi:uncharacterized protein [Antennarius striatus]